jgi:hypothetical protein
VLYYHNNSIPTALQELFPEIGIKQEMFRQSMSIFTKYSLFLFSLLSSLFSIFILIHYFVTFCGTGWRNKQNRRKFFEEFAEKRSFDPLLPENWYLQSKKQIKQVALQGEKEGEE